MMPTTTRCSLAKNTSSMASITVMFLVLLLNSPFTEGFSISRNSKKQSFIAPTMSLHMLAPKQPPQGDPRDNVHVNAPNSDNIASPAGEQSQQLQSDESNLKGNRFSKYAPDANLPTDEFRAQLRENMKADLERRRREDPNRGNQIAKSYLDSL